MCVQVCFLEGVLSDAFSASETGLAIARTLGETQFDHAPERV
jgi:hypothetical protein